VVVIDMKSAAAVLPVADRTTEVLRLRERLVSILGHSILA